MANLGMFFGFGVYDSCIPQIDAVCDYLRELGFKKIVIAGHGLGGCLAVEYAALRNDPEKYPHIVGAVAISTPYSLPETVAHRWKRFNGTPTYEEVYDKAKKVFQAARGRESATDEIIVINRAHGETTLPIHAEVYTLKTWWYMAGPEAEGAKTYKHIGKIKVPILLVHGLQDIFITQDEFEELAKIAKEGSSKGVTEVTLDANHVYDGKHDELGDALIAWLNQECERKWEN